jgi:hypothetical protein
LAGILSIKAIATVVAVDHIKGSEVNTVQVRDNNAVETAYKNCML